MHDYDDLSSVSVVELMAANNWQSQYRLITQWGKLIQHKPGLRVHQNLIRGCETPAWLARKIENNRHRFLFDSDSKIINGLAALVLAQLEDKTTAEIQSLDIAGLMHSVGLEKHLTPSRNNGLQSILARARDLVADY
jgi:cysteine desulfuration protein SufE